MIKVIGAKFLVSECLVSDNDKRSREPILYTLVKSFIKITSRKFFHKRIKKKNKLYLKFSCSVLRKLDTLQKPGFVSPYYLLGYKFIMAFFFNISSDARKK